MAATASSSTSTQLERMASELRCPICLSLYKQAASLSCNHCFCTSCIMQSMRRISCCPICKVPSTPREVRSAPQMDSLVAIFKGMETSAGVSLVLTQPSQPKGTGAGEQHACQEMNLRKSSTSRGRNGGQIADTGVIVENTKISPSKKRRLGKSVLALSDRANRQACNAMGDGVGKKAVQPIVKDLDRSDDFIPQKRRFQVTQGPSQLDVRASDKENAPQSQTNCVPSDPNTSSSSFKQLDPAPKDAAETNPRATRRQECEDKLTMDSRSEVLSSQMKSSDALGSQSPGSRNDARQRGLSPTHFPYLASFREQSEQLAPFFWLRDQVLPSQDEPPTQPTQTQPTARPIRPSFSDLKGSDDENSEDVQDKGKAVGLGLLDADSYDSDTFVWTQRPCSPELCSSPLKNSDKELCLQHKSFNGQEVLCQEEKTRHGVDDEWSKSPPKCFAEASVAVEATQTPQLHQEPARIMKGTLSKCSRLNQRERDKSVSKVCRSLRSNDSLFPNSGRHRLLAKSLKRRAFRSRKHRGFVPENSSQEAHASATPGTKSDDVLLDSSLAEGFHNQNDLTGFRQNDSSKGEKSTADGELRHEPVKNDLACVFCRSAGDSEEAGPIVEYKVAFSSQGLRRMRGVLVHKLCAEWAPDVYFKGDEPKNLACEVTRGQKIKCSSCGMRGAVLGCCNRRCKRSYHYPCALVTSGCKWDEDDFVMFCPQHADCKFPRRKTCIRGPSKSQVLPATELNNGEITNKNASPVGTVSRQLPKWPIGPACKWVLCGSGLDCQTKGQLVSFAWCTGASIVKHWSPFVTHIIIGTDEQGAAKRTLKFLMAMLVGKWIVNIEWMRDGMTAGHILAEELYEVNIDVNGFIGGPKRGRALATARGPKLLEGLSFYFCGEFTSVGKRDLQSLVAAGGGIVLHRKPLPLEQSLSRLRTKVPQIGQSIVLYNGKDDNEGTNEQLEGARAVACQAGASAAPHNWLLDSVGACMLQPID